MVHTQGWVLGTDEFSVEPPEFALEGSIMPGLLLVEDHFRVTEEQPPHVSARSGIWGTPKHLSAWFDKGALGMVSAATSSIVKVDNKLPNQ